MCLLEIFKHYNNNGDYLSCLFFTKIFLKCKNTFWILCVSCLILCYGIGNDHKIFLIEKFSNYINKERKLHITNMYMLN